MPVSPLLRKAYSPMVARGSGIVSWAREAQPSKELLPIVTTPVGILTLVKAAQPEKEVEDIRVPTLPLKLTEVKAVQFVQKKSLTLTLLGMESVVRPVQSAKLPISTTVSGKVISVKPEQPMKALFTRASVDGKVMEVSAVQFRNMRFISNLIPSAKVTSFNLGQL